MENGDAFPSGVSGDTLPQDFPVGMRVLVVEDDPNCLADLTQILESCGYKVTAKASPREALEEVEENGEGFHFDVIMTVVHGGEGGAGFDGFDLLERIRDRYPVIIFSTDYSKKMVMRTINEGACCFLAKPLCYQEMRNIWFHVLQWRDERGLEVDDPDEGVQGTRQRECCLGVGIGLHGRGLGVAVPGVCVGVGWLLVSVVLAVRRLLAAGQKYV